MKWLGKFPDSFFAGGDPAAGMVAGERAPTRPRCVHPVLEGDDP
jgi:hypothetical protein